MGADFLLYSLPWAQLDEARQKLLHDTIDQLKDEPLQEVADGVGLFDDDDLSKVRTALHTAVREYLELDNRRDTTTWRNWSDPITRVYTGGLSWGEAPTDCCQTFDVIATCEPICEMLQRWAVEDADSGAKAAQPCDSHGMLREVLAEFCKDIEAAGRGHVAEEWPDLVITYDKAKEALRDWANNQSASTV